MKTILSILAMTPMSVIIWMGVRICLDELELKESLAIGIFIFLIFAAGIGFYWGCSNLLGM